MTKRKDPKDRLKMGAPTRYKPEYIAKAIEYGERGCSVTKLAADLNVAKDSLYEWAKVYPDFSVAMQKMRAKAEAYWEEKGIENLWAKDFNGGMWMFFMKCRFAWRDREKSEHVNVYVSHEDSLKELE